MHELILNSNEKSFLAVDIGSNAMRASIAALDSSNDLEVLSTLRFPLRLGEEVFQNNKISKRKIAKTLQAFKELAETHKKFNFHRMRVAATSAIRDASNGKDLVELIKKETGFKIDIIGGEEEAELIYKAVAAQLELEKSNTLLIDVGGGSTEITLCHKQKIVFSRSYNCGTVRLLESGQYNKQKEIIQDFVKSAKKDLKDLIKKHPIDLCVGTGGNLRRMGKLRKIFFKRSNLKVSQVELSSILAEIKAFTIEQRMDYLDMREDRADVIIPACTIIEEILLKFQINEILLPKVGLKEGLIIDLLDQKPRNIFFS